MTPGRPVGAPAYYLGRPASVWLSIARRRPAPVVDRQGACQQTGSRRPAA
jgi:hypothetical protein